MVTDVRVVYIRLTFSCSKFLVASSAALASPFVSRITKINRPLSARAARYNIAFFIKRKSN